MTSRNFGDLLNPLGNGAPFGNGTPLAMAPLWQWHPPCHNKITVFLQLVHSAAKVPTPAPYLHDVILSVPKTT